MNDLYGSILDDYWPSERKVVEEAYKNIKLPLQELDAPNFRMNTDWELSQLVRYLRTWSALKLSVFENTFVDAKYNLNPKLACNGHDNKSLQIVTI